MRARGHGQQRELGEQGRGPAPFAPSAPPPAADDVAERGGQQRGGRGRRCRCRVRGDRCRERNDGNGGRRRRRWRSAPAVSAASVVAVAATATATGLAAAAKLRRVDRRRRGHRDCLDHSGVRDRRQHLYPGPVRGRPVGAGAAAAPAAATTAVLAVGVLKVRGPVVPGHAHRAGHRTAVQLRLRLRLRLQKVVVVGGGRGRGTVVVVIVVAETFAGRPRRRPAHGQETAE